ncbi:PTS sugar transporter subunit IIB [Fundicoccus culcitae]|uniref:PTS sugar transporter subunit IIB n=1 Tax=Fundicoccus culcitae TaxID=2969821 RepID=A0ABY5PA69_9LACT|nr:PTS sugar transporter subunit IIB [Fundicoccus culcitae]UUX35405.1 PTS sugar transporter subunit IIB [Fundicoccus culcitae]
MKILLVCAGGMSTSILMKKMEKYWEEQGIDLDIRAVGLGNYAEYAKEYEIILVGPQVSYKLQQIKEDTGLPTEAIPSYDYAIANTQNILKLAQKLYAQK